MINLKHKNINKFVNRQFKVNKNTEIDHYKEYEQNKKLSLRRSSKSLKINKNLNMNAIKIN